MQSTEFSGQKTTEQEDREVKVGQRILEYNDRTSAALNGFIPDVKTNEPPCYSIKDIGTMVMKPAYTKLEMDEKIKTVNAYGVHDDRDGNNYDIAITVAVDKTTKQLIFLNPVWRENTTAKATITTKHARALVLAWEGQVRAVHVRVQHFNKLRFFAAANAMRTAKLWREYFVGMANPEFEGSVADWVTNGVGKPAVPAPISSSLPSKHRLVSSRHKLEDDEDGEQLTKAKIRRCE